MQKSVFVPVMIEKGEIRAEVVFGREAVSVNTAYAFDDKFAVLINGFSTIDNSSTYRRKYNLQLEAGAGYFKTIRDSFHFESYAGASIGKYDNSFYRYSNNISDFEVVLYGLFGHWYVFLNSFDHINVNARGNYYTAFWQNSFTLLTGRSSTSYTARLQYVKFIKHEEQGEYNGEQFWYGIKVPGKLFLQPVITNKVSLSKNGAVTAQLGYNVELFKNHSKKEVFEWNAVFYSIGMEFMLNRSNW